MKKIIEYKLVTSDNENSFVLLVNDEIKSGFQPYGFTEIKGEYQYTTYTLAMVKYEK